MNVQVKIIENNPTEFTYFVTGANSIEEAKQMAKRCYETRTYSNNCYLGRTIPRYRTVKFGAVQITEYDQLALANYQPAAIMKIM